MKYLFFTLCLILGIGFYFLSSRASVRNLPQRAPEATPRKVLIVARADKPQVIMPTQ